MTTKTNQSKGKILRQTFPRDHLEEVIHIRRHNEIETPPAERVIHQKFAVPIVRRREVVKGTDTDQFH